MWFSYGGFSFETNCYYSINFTVFKADGSQLTIDDPLVFIEYNQSFSFFTNNIRLLGRQKYKVQAMIDDSKNTTVSYEFVVDVKSDSLLSSSSLNTIVSSNLLPELTSNQDDVDVSFDSI